MQSIHQGEANDAMIYRQSQSFKTLRLPSLVCTCWFVVTLHLTEPTGRNGVGKHFKLRTFEAGLIDSRGA